MSYFSNYSDVLLFTNPNYLNGAKFSAVVAFGTNIYVACGYQLDPVAIYKIDATGNVTVVITTSNLTFTPDALGIDSTGTTLIAVSPFSQIATINTTTLQRTVFTMSGGVDVTGNGSIYVDSPTSFYIVNQSTYSVTYVTLTPGPNTFTAIDYTAPNSIFLPVAVVLDPLTNNLYSAGITTGSIFSYPLGGTAPVSVTPVTTLAFSISDLAIVVENNQSYLYVVSHSKNTLTKYLINGGSLTYVDAWNTGSRPSFVAFSQTAGTLIYYLIQRYTISTQSSDLFKLY